MVHWSADGWRTTEDARARDTGLGIHVVDVSTTRLPPGSRVRFTFYWLEADRWEGTDFEVTVAAEIGA